MQPNSHSIGDLRRLKRTAFLRLLLVVLTMTSWSTPATELIPSVVIGNNFYSNVVVREVADRSITLSHTRGMATLSIDKLTRKEKENLKLIAPEPEPVPKTNGPFQDFNLSSLDVMRSPEDRSAAMAQAKEFVEYFKSPEGIRELLESLPPVRPMALIAPVVIYLLFSMCFVVICAKAGKPAHLLGWIPVVQIFPLYRAANMSPFWFVALLLNLFMQMALLGVAVTKGLPQRALMIAGMILLGLTVIHLIGWIIWCFKIAKARGKGPIVGFFMLLPVTNLLALAYLTFSGNGKASATPVKKIAREPIGLRLLI